MKVARVLGLALLLAAFLSADALAGEGWTIEGTLESFNSAENEIVVNTEVAGLMGPSTRTMTFKVIPNMTTFSICYEISRECYLNVDVDRGWSILESYEGLTSFSVLDKKVKVVKNDAGYVTGVEIVYHR